MNPVKFQSFFAIRVPYTVQPKVGGTRSRSTDCQLVRRLWAHSVECGEEPDVPAFSAALCVSHRHLPLDSTQREDGSEAKWSSDALRGPVMRASAGRFAVMASPAVSSVHTSACVAHMLHRSHQGPERGAWSGVRSSLSAGHSAFNQARESSPKGRWPRGYYPSPYQPLSSRTPTRASFMSSCTNTNDMCTQ